MWDLPEPGIEPVSPALAGGFLTTAPPGKPPIPNFIFVSLYLFSDEGLPKLYKFQASQHLESIL